MKMNDMVIISVDDHICEPPNLFDKQLSGELLATAPKLKVDKNGTNYWSYQGMKFPSVGLNAVVGRPFEEYGMEPTSLDQLRKGCYDVHARIDDMDVNGIAASLCFGNSIAFNGRNLPPGGRQETRLKAPSGLQRLALRGMVHGLSRPFHPHRHPADLGHRCHRRREPSPRQERSSALSSMNENPTVQGLPSIHNDYWDPVFKAVVDTGMTIALHIGSGNPAPHASMETPIEAWISTMPMSVAQGLADWLQLEELHKYPQLRIAISEGSIGWVPYFMERADFSNWRHKTWTKSRFQDFKPSEMVKRHFLHCFLSDASSLKNLDAVGEDNAAYEVDYPHSDALWPDAAEQLWEQVKHLTDAQIEKVSHRNAIRWFRHDALFENYKREEVNVGALHAKAKAKGVDTTPKSSGGSKPLTENRPVTSGDITEMFKAHAAARDAA